MPSDTPYFDPNDPNMGSQSDASQREAGNQDVMASLTQRVQANRQYQQWLASRGGRLSDAERKQAAQLLQHAGLSLPEGMEVNAQGQVVPIDHTTRDRIILAAMAAPLLLPSSAAGAAAAGASGGAGATAAGAGGMSGLMGAGEVVPSAALGAGGGLAPAATGGGLLATLGRYGDRFADVGNVLSNAASANAQGRRGDSLADMNAATANNRARVDVGTFNMDAPNTRAMQVARGDLMSANIPDSQTLGTGRNVSFSGGLRPSLFTQATTDAGNALKRQSLDALLNNSDHIDPQLVDPRRAGAGENVAGGLGLGLNILGALSGLKRGTNGTR